MAHVRNPGYRLGMLIVSGTKDSGLIQDVDDEMSLFELSKYLLWCTRNNQKTISL